MIKWEIATRIPVQQKMRKLMIENRFRHINFINLAKRKEITEKIKDYLFQRKDVLFAYLYGSFVRDEAFRDIDVALFMKNSIEELNIESDISYDLMAITGYPVEARTINKAPVAFQMAVLREEFLFSQDDDRRADFIQDVGKRYIEYSHLGDGYWFVMIDKDRITKNKLDIIRISDQIEGLIKQEKEAFLSDIRNIYSLKYLLIEAVEAIVDTCQHILAKTKGIPCDGYVDCIVKAGEKGIISLSLANNLRRLADLRNSLIHRYWVIDDTRLYLQTIRNKQSLEEFVQEIENFIVSL